ncbi:MAG: peptide deformylase [Bacillota bacterium]
MAIMNIRIIGDPVLRSKAKEVDEINDKTKELLDNMAETMYDADGAGLAAPQVGVLQRIFIVDDGEGLTEFINPEIISKNGRAIMEEGCLSVPGETGTVVRAKEVVVEALNREGEKFKIEASDLKARAILHEYDHLEGILYVDKKISEEQLKGIEVEEN